MQENLHHHHHPFSGVPNSTNRRKSTPFFIPQNHVAVRMLCHVSRVGGLIGKSGSIIRHLQDETSTKIRVEDVPDPTEPNRVIVIIGSVTVCRKIGLDRSEKGNNSVEELEVFEVSAVQEGVVRVFERVIEVAAESDDVGVEVGRVVSCRLLVERGQVGLLIGKGGRNIEMLKRESGSRIKVLTKERLPACALANDEIVELEGDIKAVKKGLIAVSRCLQDYSIFDSRNMNGGRSFESVMQEPSFDPHKDLVHRGSVGPNKSANYNGFSVEIQSLSEEQDMDESRRSHRQVIFKILCPYDRVGGVLGKGGSIIRDLQAETGATISIGPSIPDCPERLITISAIENPGSRYSPAQSAVILVFNRLVAASPVNDIELYSLGAPVSARIVVSTNEVGCLLGKGGSIISEMRKVTGAALRAIGCDEVPKCTAGNVEIVQITGALENVRNAIYSVTTRLRENLSSLRMPNGTGRNSASPLLHKNIPYGGARGHPVTEQHPLNGVSNGSDQHSSIVHYMGQLRLGQTTDPRASPNSWTAQTISRGSQRSNGGVGNGSGSRSAVVMNATLEIVVPDNVIDSVYGENGTNLSRLKQISGAKVMVHERRHGSTDRIIVISGSPEQTQAAQSLLQAFLFRDPINN